MRFTIFAAHPELTYGFSTKADGSMHRVVRASERQAYLRAFGIDPRTVVTADLVHGVQVERVTREEGGSEVPKTDALVCTEPDMYLTVTGADCLPLYFYDPVRRAVGIAHAGWRGVVGGIASNTVSALVDQCGSDPRDILCGIGPGIRSCHFSISDEHVQHFAPYRSYLEELGGVLYGDLAGAVYADVERAGLLPHHIEDCKECTYCLTGTYFSYRRDRPDELELMLAYLGVNNTAL